MGMRLDFTLMRWKSFTIEVQDLDEDRLFEGGEGFEKSPMMHMCQEWTMTK